MSLELLKGLAIGSTADKNIIDIARTVMVNMPIDKEYIRTTDDSLKTMVMRELNNVSKSAVTTSDELWKELVTYCIAKNKGLNISLRKAIWDRKTTSHQKDMHAYNLLVCVDENGNPVWTEDYEDSSKELILGDVCIFRKKRGK